MLSRLLSQLARPSRRAQRIPRVWIGQPRFLSSDLEKAQAWARDDPEGFWLDKAQAIPWYTPPTSQPGSVLDRGRGAAGYTWFPEATLNTAFCCLDYHVTQGRGDQAALVHHSAYEPERSTVYTYCELLGRVEKFAGALAGMGVGHGDRVIIYMPMVGASAKTCAARMWPCSIKKIHLLLFLFSPPPSPLDMPPLRRSLTGARRGGGHARLRAARGCAQRRLRGFCLQGAREPHRRRAAQGRCHRLVRPRAGKGTASDGRARLACGSWGSWLPR